MPTYAGYMMTPEQQFAWLRENHPDLVDKYTRAPGISHLMVERMKELKLMNAFCPTPIMCPQPNPETIPPDSMAHLGFMFVRQQDNSNTPVWLPPQNIRGQQDILAGKYLRKKGFPVGDWAVVFQPAEDPGLSVFVHPPESLSVPRNE